MAYLVGVTAVRPLQSFSPSKKMQQNDVQVVQHENVSPRNSEGVRHTLEGLSCHHLRLDQRQDKIRQDSYNRS